MQGGEGTMQRRRGSMGLERRLCYVAVGELRRAVVAVIGAGWCGNVVVARACRGWDRQRCGLMLRRLLQ